MRLFDFFRKKVKESEIRPEKIAFSEIENFLTRKTNKIETREKEIFVLIQKKVDIFTNELKEKINDVEKVDIESKKVEDKIKFIVNEGRKKYLESVMSFIENLERLEKNRFEKFIEDINKIFLNFNKSSHMSYERATILIGKEMAKIKESLKVFSRDLMKIFDENKEIINSSETIFLIELKLNKITENSKIIKKVDEKIMFLDKRITKEKEEIEKIQEEIEKIKKSEDYIRNLEKQKKVKLSEEELEKEILSLKQLINFKALANFFHIFKEQMNIVKTYRENFQTEFRKDNGKELINLLDEAKLNNKTISEKIMQINNKKQAIIKNKQEIKEDKTQELYLRTTKIILEIGNLKNEKERVKKGREKLKISNEEMTKEIKEELKVIEVEIVDY